MSDLLLKINNLKVIYKTDEATVSAVNGIDFEIGYKETIGLVGETGAGKTTTALSILQLLPDRTGVIESGEIIFKGENLLTKSEGEMKKIRGQGISMIFQDPMTSLNPIMTVSDQIRESLEIENRNKGTGLRSQELDNKVDNLLRMVGIQPARKKEYPNQFSGGMKQRVMIAIALACNPALIIADEPTTALDVTIQAQVLNLIAQLKQDTRTSMIMITHDLGVVAQTCEKVYVMYAGEIIEKGFIEDIFENSNIHPYTKGLFESIPDLEFEAERLFPIEGLMPDPTYLPQGCKFHPRCKFCMPICTREIPAIFREGQHEISCHLYKKENAKEN